MKWSVAPDDRLEFAADTAAFLQGFCPPSADPVWSEGFLHWKLGDANPAGRGFCTIARTDNQVVGCASITPKRLRVGGQDVIGGELGDCYTNSEMHRHGVAATPHPSDPSPKAYLNRSIFGRLVTETRARAEAAGIKLIYGTPNASAMPGYRKRLGFPEFGAHRTENYLRPTVTGLGERFPRLRPWTGLLAPADRFYASLTAAVQSLSAPGFQVTPFEGDDREIDSLWQRTRDDLPFTLVRDARWFRYRYRDHPLGEYEMHAVRRRGSLRALMVTRRFVTLRGRPYLYVADWLFPRGDGRMFGRALTAAVRRTDPRSVDGILMWAEVESEPAAVARRNSFLARGKSALIFADTPEAAALADKAPRLEFCIGFSDNV